MPKLHDNDIFLDSKKHIYTLTNDPDFSFTSSTTFIHKFFAPFEKYKIAKKLVNMPKYRGRTVQSFIDEWKASTEKGNKVHEELEDFILEGKKPVSSPAKHGVGWLSLFSENMKMMPEVIVYSKELGIAGMVDLLMYNPSTRMYTLVDWKTNKRIDKTAYRGKTGIREATKDIEDCNFNKYSLQLSLYKYILQKYYKIPVISQLLIHVTDDKAVSYLCPYMKETLEKMFEEEKLLKKS